MRTKKEIEEMMGKLYKVVEKDPNETLRVIFYNDCLSWVLGDDYLDQYLKDMKSES